MSDAATHRVPANTDPGPTPSTTPVTPINNENPSTAAFAPAPSPEATIESAGKLVYLKRSEFLSHMLRSIDIIVYTHISYLYLLDCSMTRLVLSAFTQLWALTPKPLSPPISNLRPILLTILASTLFSIFHHTLSAAPSAGEEVQGYLHGGILIDFVGQKGPTSKVRLVLIDILILILQMLQLSVLVTKIDTPPYATILANSTAAREGAGGGEDEEGEGVGVSGDLDDEERGQFPPPLYHPDGSLRERPALPRSETAESSFATTPEEEEERQRLEIKRRSYQITSGEFEVVKIDVVEMLQRVWARKLGAVPQGDGGLRRRPGTDDVDMEAGEAIRRARAWRFRFSAG